jgi:hypothetical protein
MILGFSGYLVFGTIVFAYSIEERDFTSSVRFDHWARVRENYEDYTPLCCIVRRSLLMTERDVATDAPQVLV